MQPRYETSTFAPNVQWAGIEDAAAGLVPSAPTLQVSDDHFYHTGLAAHHISQLFHSIDQDALLSGRKEGGPGIGDGIHVSHGPSIGPRAAPRSKTRPNVASKLTIQERRRLTRSLRDACCREEGRMVRFRDCKSIESVADVRSSRSWKHISSQCNRLIGRKHRSRHSRSVAVPFSNHPC